MPWELVILATGQRFLMAENREYYVGSSRAAHLHLAAADVSHTHALLCAHRDHLQLLDLGSKNGTFHNGKRITTARVHNGDTVAFSSVKAQALLVQEAPPEPPAKPSIERETSHTGEFPVVPAEEDLVSLLRSWDVAPEMAVTTLLCWLVGARSMVGCALMELAQGKPAILAGQGQLPANVVGHPAVGSCLARDFHPENPWEVHQVVEGETPFLLSQIGHGRGLLLLPGSRSPSAQELELIQRLARLALRLAGTPPSHRS
ncbi:MAG: FHA domain-containing protein [Thermoanaerobaculaceae bacterium]